MKHQSDETEPPAENTGDENDFRDIFALGRFFEGVRDLRRNGPGFSHFAYLHDICMASVAIFIAFVIVPGNLATLDSWYEIQTDIFVFTGLAAFAFLVLRPYRSLWRYSSLSDLLSILTVSTIVSLSYFVTDRTIGPFSIAEWGTYINAWLLMIMLMSGPRVATRLAAVPNMRNPRAKMDDRVKLLLVGAGDGTELFIRALNRDPAARFRIIGIVDEMGFNLRRRIHGVEVLGAPNDLDAIVSNLDRKGMRPQRLVITEEHLSPASLQGMLDEA